jgi:hypothetical protein
MDTKGGSGAEGKANNEMEEGISIEEELGKGGRGKNQEE